MEHRYEAACAEYERMFSLQSFPLEEWREWRGVKPRRAYNPGRNDWNREEDYIDEQRCLPYEEY